MLRSTYSDARSCCSSSTAAAAVSGPADDEAAADVMDSSRDSDSSWKGAGALLLSACMIVTID